MKNICKLFVSIGLVALLLLSPPARAAAVSEYALLLAVMSTLSIPISGPIDNVCTGEQVVLDRPTEGTADVNLTQDGHLQIKYRMLANGIQGTGQSSGNTYVMVGAGNARYHVIEQDGVVLPTQMFLRERFSLISPGSASNMTFTLNAKVNIAADGKVAVEDLPVIIETTCSN